ncbi:hypothetical protein [Jeotgalibacillus salarius]|uniref:Uncharacterized protein n=1 Tax=Jeotgalibacillus salarius TaxID=546023 RepID=A0A4Y8LM04_9BACL|nr:hypothetical protein [Jeotgalibacillus salarius]TFE02287.1 hypothetical protein E2626_06825 [Jeotgalibacillus salarius]
MAFFLIFLVCGFAILLSVMAFGPWGLLLIAAVLSAFIVKGYFLLSAIYDEMTRKEISKEQRFKEATEKYKVK